MRKLHIITLMVSACTLAACGGSGSGNQVDNHTNSNTSSGVNTQPSKETYHLTPEQREAGQRFSSLMQPQSTGNFNGVGVVTGYNELKNGTATTGAIEVFNGFEKDTLSTESFLGKVSIPKDNTFHKNGVNVYGSTSENDPYNYMGKSYRYFMVSNNNYNSVQFGLAETAGYPRILLGFVRANTTPEALMPTVGKAKYSGVVLFPVGIDKVNAQSMGNMVANVDFGNKSVDFNVTAGSNYKANISAEIVGSVFMGIDSGKTIDGIFAGDNAEEMTGVYKDSKANLLGFYGAKRKN